jgi:hypothetical protein
MLSFAKLKDYSLSLILFNGFYTECHSTKGPYVKGHYAKGHYAKGHYAKGQYAKGHYAKGHYANGDYAKGDYAKAYYGKGHYASCRYDNCYAERHYCVVITVAVMPSVLGFSHELSTPQSAGNTQHYKS